MGAASVLVDAMKDAGAAPDATAGNGKGAPANA